MNKNKTIAYIKQNAVTQLIGCGILREEATKEVNILLEFISNISIKDIILYPDKLLEDNQAQKFEELIAKRIKDRTPIQYLINKAHFMDENYYVDHRVLIPRPETELLVAAAVEIYNALSPEDKTSPTAYRLAVKEAASDLGVLPVRKRKQSDDDSYLASSSSSPEGKPSSRRSAKEDEIDTKTIAFAKMVGLNTDDPKVVENLKQRSKRQNWSRYE